MDKRGDLAPGPILRRHDLVWLEPTAALAAPDQPARAVARAWAAAGRPFVARRRGAGEPPGVLALGLPLPNRLGRRRIALSAAPHALARVAPPPRLSDASAVLPPAWRAIAADLRRALAACGSEVRVYGSVAWEWLSGESYLRPGSDVDLLIEPCCGWQPDEALAALRRIEDCRAPRFDGEVALGDGAFVAWRELLGSSPQLLVKTGEGLALRRRADLAGQFAPARAA